MYLNVTSKLGKEVNVSEARWQLIITTKHPEIKDKENEVRQTLSDPDEIRLSNTDQSVYLYYRKYEKLSLVVVTKHMNGEGFIITAYLQIKLKRESKSSGGHNEQVKSIFRQRREYAGCVV